MISFDLTTFLLGAVGAFAPEIVRLWELRTNEEKFAWTSRYIVASAGMCLLGGVVALCLEPDTAWKALYGGLTAPVLISTAARKLPARRASRLKGTRTASPWWQSFLVAL